MELCFRSLDLWFRVSCFGNKSRHPFGEMGDIPNLAKHWRHCAVKTYFPGQHTRLGSVYIYIYTYIHNCIHTVFYFVHAHMKHNIYTCGFSLNPASPRSLWFPPAAVRGSFGPGEKDRWGPQGPRDRWRRTGAGRHKV